MADLVKKMAVASYKEKTPQVVQEADKAALDKAAAEIEATSGAMDGFRAMLAS